jgi:HD-like signal output (HDOD) protein
MFWKIFDKKTPAAESTDALSTTEPSTDHGKPINKGKVIELPLTFLQKLTPLNNLSHGELLQLSIRSASYPAGHIIFKRDERTDSLVYLLKGKVFLETGDGSGYETCSETLKALFPLSSVGQHNLSAIAKSDVTVIFIPRQALLLCNKMGGLLVNSKQGIPKALKENSFFTKFNYNFRHGNLEIPTMPDLSIKLQQAIRTDPTIHKIVKIVEIDPVIALKLIQVANSPLYRSANPIKNCHGAINRLGLTTTRNLVTSISLRSHFKSHRKSINIRFRALWQQSVNISVLSSILASVTGKADPGEALLAGLVHNIGALPLLKFADEQGMENCDDELDLCLRHAQGFIGKIVLEKWDFPENLVKLPIISENWYYDDRSDFSLGDIIILAKFHSLLGTKAMSLLPPITTLPAYQKLDNKTLSTDMSLQILHEAKQQISDIVSLFSN